MTAANAQEYLFLGLRLLDRQIVDVDDRQVGKVDDVELSDAPFGAEEGPVVTALLCGPAAYGPRIGGRLGNWIVSIHRWLIGDEPIRIPWAYVARVQSAIEITVPRDEAGTTRLDDWIAAHFIGRIPGAGHASE